MKRLFWLWLAITGWLALWPNVVYAQPTTPTISRAVSDYADVMDAPSIAVIERALVDHRGKTGTQIAVLVVFSTNDQPIEDYALRAAVRWGGGSKEQDNGVLAVIAVADRRSRIEVGYGLEATLTDSVAKSILDGLRPELVEGDYAAAVAKLCNDLLERTGGTRSIQLPPNRQIKRTVAPQNALDPPSYDPKAADGFDFLFGVVLLLIFVIWVYVMVTRSSRGQTFSSSGSSSSSSWSGSSASSSLFGGSSSGFGSSSGSSWSGSSGGSSSSSSSGSSYSGGGGGFGGGGASSSW